MNFIPNPGKYNTNNLETDKNNFVRNIILRSYFRNDTNQQLDPYFSLKISDKQWLPKETHHIVNTFVENFQKEFSELKPCTDYNRDNLKKGRKKSAE